MKALLNFLKDEDGITTIEYVLLASGIAVLVVAVVGAMNPSLTNKMVNIVKSI